MKSTSSRRLFTLCLFLLFPLPAFCMKTVLSLQRVSFVDKDNGIVLGTTDEYSFVLLSHDGGRLWRVAYRASSLLRGALFQNHLSLWVVGSGGLILRTQDGGQSWRQSDSGTQEDINQVMLGPKGILFAVANHGLLLTSSDGGATWQNKRLGDGKDLVDVASLESGEMVILARDEILASDDDGSTWKRLGANKIETLSHLVFFNSEEGLISGGVLVRTLDGGKTMDWVNLHSNDRVGPVVIPGGSTAFLLVGKAETGSTARLAIDKLASSSSILRTDDGGATWKSVFHLQDSKSQGAWLQDLSWSEKQDGWAVGDGLIVTTHDDGATWNVCRLDYLQGQGNLQLNVGVQLRQTGCSAH